MKFKTWFETEEQKFRAFGQEVNTPEEFDKLSWDYYRSKGYSDNDIKRIMKMVDTDNYTSHRLDKKAWVPFDSPYYKRVWNVVMMVLEKEAKKELQDKAKSKFGSWFDKKIDNVELHNLIRTYSRVFLWIIKEDPVARSNYEELHEVNLTEQEVKQFVDYLKKMKIWDYYLNKYRKDEFSYSSFLPIYIDRAREFFGYNPKDASQTKVIDSPLN